VAGSTQQPLTWDQRHTLARLQLLLRRRCLAESLGLAQEGGQLAELLHALDEAIVSSYRFAQRLGVQDQTEGLLAGFRANGFVKGKCLEAPPRLEDPPDHHEV
jgi:hypothetical protein